MIQSLVDSLGDAVNPWGYVLLFLLCLLEASAFIGLFIPGETALLIAGVLAHEDKLSLSVAIACAVVGAILGDSLGYEIGRHLGPRLRSSRLGRTVGEHRWEKALDFVRRNGGKSIFFGRWIGVLRALVPAIAGDARMEYKRFLLWNVLGAIVATPAVILLGYVAGESYEVVEKRLGQITYVLVGVVVGFFVVRHVLKKRREDAEEVEATDTAEPGQAP